MDESLSMNYEENEEDLGNEEDMENEDEEDAD